MRTKIFGLAVLLMIAVSTTGAAQELATFTNSFGQTLTTPEASVFVKQNGESYNQKNWLNPVLHNLYMVNNRSEAAQYRINLDNISRFSNGHLRFQDLLGSEPLDWSTLSPNRFKDQVQQYHSIAALETTNLNKPQASIIVLFSSTSHNLLSLSTLDVVQDLTKAGMIVAMLEYPGYGGSLGTPSKSNWEKASDGFVRYLNKMFPERKIFLMGHSLGGPVALSVASRNPAIIQGVISHAGFINLFEASKDSSKFLFSNQIAPIVTALLARKENWDSSKSLESLAQHRVPVLILHGKNDRSVSYRHFNLLREKGLRLQSSSPSFPFFTKAFPSTHEDVFANAKYSDYYREIWTSILEFISSN